MTEITITIKKGLDLIHSILESANKIKFNQIARVSVYGNNDPEASLIEAGEKIVSGVHDVIQLIGTHYNIKRSIGLANDQLGITILIRERVKYEALEKRLAAIVKDFSDSGSDSMYSRMSGPAMSISDMAAIRDRIKLSRDRILTKDQVSSSEESFSVNVVSDKFRDELENELYSVRRQKATCIDQIALLNVNNKIVISDADVRVLQKHKLL